jgi:Flp pilus assembly secretin CpaC
MAPPTHRRVSWSGPALLASLAFCLSLTCFPPAAPAQIPADQDPATERPQAPVPQPAAAPVTDASGSAVPVAPAGSHTIEPAPSVRKARAAEEAYLAGAKKLERDDLDAAENDFKRALALDPEDRDYAVAISVTRQHRITELVQQSTEARQAGDQARAETLLARANGLDPQNPIVTEHIATALLKSSPRALPPDASPHASKAVAGNQSAPSENALTDRAGLVAGGEARAPWVVEAPALAPPIRLTPSPDPKSFHLRGTFKDVLQQVAGEYGIRTTFDDSVESKAMRFDVENISYDQAMSALNTMTHTFAVPLEPTSILLARDDSADRQRLERQSQETVYLPGLVPDRIREIADVMRNIFDAKQAIVQPGDSTIVVRAPEAIFAPMNTTIAGLLDSTGEVVIEMKLYEITTTRSTNIGAALPAQAGIYSVEQAATALVQANQALVNQAIAQGLGGLTANSSNILIAGELIASGLAQSSLLSTTIGSIGGGLTLLGITASTNTNFNFGQNSSESRALDDVQMRVEDRQPATLREGTRYPITSSTYTTGISTAASQLGNATINGVSVASLLSQFAGGSTSTIPQVTYEDLGITLLATPTIMKSGHVNLVVNLKIEALAGSSANGIPVLENSQFASGITLEEGDSAILVSNVSKNETAAMSGIPGLSELPGFQLPTQENTEKDTNQLIILLTPHVVRRRSDTIAGPRIAMRAEPVN